MSCSKSAYNPYIQSNKMQLYFIFITYRKKPSGTHNVKSEALIFNFKMFLLYFVKLY